jgi:peptide/nickel transport system permease protein
MRRYALKRLLLGIITLFGVSLVVFIAVRLSGDPALLLAPPDASQQELQTIRAELGLDKPMPIQYIVFMRNALKGDFGRSTRYHRPALPLVLSRLPATMELAVIAFCISISIGITFGVASVTKPGSWFDILGKTFASLGQAMPEFWIGIMAVLIFSVWLGWFPTSGRGGITHLVLPAVTLGWFSAASILRLTRSAMLKVMGSEFIKTARLKGNAERTVIWRHALRNAIIPVVAMGGMQLGRLLGGAVIVETIFSWPGLGQLILDGVYSRDYSVVQAGVFITSTIFVLLNLLVDLSYGIIDPRIRYE